MNKHAYLMAVHKNQKQIEILLGLLDIKENDIYIHIDKKSKSINEDELKACIHKAGLFFVDRISVGWARYSIVESTIIMLKAAINNGPYSYYHLISGQDLPLKPIEEINRYYNFNDPDWNYLEFKDDDWARTMAYSRANYFRFHKDNESGFASKLHGLQKRIYNFFNIRNEFLRAGSAWFDINHKFAEDIVKNEEWIKQRFEYAQFPDEAFLQTLVYKLGLEKTCHDNMRYIDWKTGPTLPRVFTIEDYDRLIGSGMNFARKFDIEQDKEIIKKISSHIKEHEEILA